MELQADEVKETMRIFDHQMRNNIGKEHLVTDGEKPDQTYWSDLRESSSKCNKMMIFR